MKKQIEIKILGQKFMVRSDSDEEYINKVASFVDEKVNEMMRTSKSVASLNMVILAAMNIADEFFKYKMQKDKQVSFVEKKIKDVIELIDLQA